MDTNSIDAAFDKAASAGKSEPAPVDQTIEKQQAPTPKPQDASPEPSGKAEPAAPAKETKPEWDGDVNKLPPEIQNWAKAAQRKLTERAMAEADLRRKGQEYDKLVSSEDWKKFKTNPQAAAIPQQPQQPTSSGITAQEWEEAQLDGSGQKINALIERETQRRISEAAQSLGPTLQQIQQQQQMTQFNTALSDFSDLHPDILEMHEDGLMKPFLEEEVRSGKHPTYEAAIQSAYERARQIAEKAQQRALQRAQGRVMEKQSAVTIPTTTSGDLSVVEVDKADAFDKAFEFALEKKKVKVKARR